MMLPACLPNLYIKKYSNLLQPVRVMVFLYATTVSLIKSTFYIKYKKHQIEAPALNKKKQLIN